MFPETNTTEFLAAMGQVTTETIPALTGYFNVMVGLALTFTILSAAIGYFRYKNKPLKTGIYTDRVDRRHYDKDQALGKIEYELQTKGVWIK